MALEQLNEESYAATVAGLSYDLARSGHGARDAPAPLAPRLPFPRPRPCTAGPASRAPPGLEPPSCGGCAGLQLQVEGFSHKLPQLLLRVVSTLAALADAPCDAPLFARVAERLELALQNEPGTKAEELAGRAPPAIAPHPPPAPPSPRRRFRAPTRAFPHGPRLLRSHRVSFTRRCRYERLRCLENAFVHADERLAVLPSLTPQRVQAPPATPTRPRAARFRQPARPCATTPLL